MKYLILLIVPLLLGCHNNPKVKAKKGRIDLLYNVYYNASKGLENNQSFYVSQLNFQQDIILEIVPDIQFPEMPQEAFFIINSTYYKLGNPNDLDQLNIFSFAQKNKAFPLSLKTKGALFGRDSIPNYAQRINLNDTLLFDKKYRRFDIETPFNFSRYYVFQTDTILPYSISKQVEYDYNGRIERIDSYNKKEDTFITLQLIHTSSWSPEAQPFFEYTNFLKKSNH